MYTFLYVMMLLFGSEGRASTESARRMTEDTPHAHENETSLDHDFEDISLQMQAVIRMSTLVLIGCLAFKIMFFLRIWANLGKLVQLVIRVIQDAFDFTLFFMGWVYVFCLVNEILAIKFDDGDYPEVGSAFVMIL